MKKKAANKKAASKPKGATGRTLTEWKRTRRPQGHFALHTEGMRLKDISNWNPVVDEGTGEDE